MKPKQSKRSVVQGKTFGQIFCVTLKKKQKEMVGILTGNDWCLLHCFDVKLVSWFVDMLTQSINKIKYGVRTILTNTENKARTHIHRRQTRVKFPSCSCCGKT